MSHFLVKIVSMLFSEHQWTCVDSTFLFDLIPTLKQRWWTLTINVVSTLMCLLGNKAEKATITQRASTKGNFVFTVFIAKESFVWYQGKTHVSRDCNSVIQKDFTWSPSNQRRVKSMLTFASVDDSAIRAEILMISFFFVIFVRSFCQTYTNLSFLTGSLGWTKIISILKVTRQRRV